MSNSPDIPGAALDASARALDLLRGQPNPFDGLVRPQRPDDRFADLHIPALLRAERELLLQIIDSYRLTSYRAARDLRDTRVVTILGARGAGKTHMLEALANREDGKAQLLVRPTYYERQLPFEEYLRAQLVNSLLAEDPALGGPPFVDIAAQLTRRLLVQAVRSLGPTDRLFVCEPSRSQRWRLLWGGGRMLAGGFDRLVAGLEDRTRSADLPALVKEQGLEPEKLLAILEAHLQQHETGDEPLASIRRQLYRAMARLTLLQDADALSRFLETDYTQANSRPFLRIEVVRQLLHALIEACALVRMPIVIAFDNLELFLAPQGEFDAEAARSFTDSLAQTVDALRGLLFLVFAEKTLYIENVWKNMQQFARDRLQQGVPIIGRGPVEQIELKPPSFEQLEPLIQERISRLLIGFPGSGQLPAGFPFSREFLDHLGEQRDMGLRNKLLRLREEYSRVVYHAGPGSAASEIPQPPPAPVGPKPDDTIWLESVWKDKLAAADRQLGTSLVSQLQALHAGLGTLLQQAGPLLLEDWRLGAVQPVVPIGDNSNYGIVTLLDWHKGDSNGKQSLVRVGVGVLVAARGPGMPKDLGVKFDLFAEKSLKADSLVVLWPGAPDSKDLASALPEATRQVWNKSRARRDAVLRRLTNDDLCQLLAIPLWLDAIKGQAEQPVAAEVIRSFVQQRCQSLFPLLLPLEPEKAASHAD